MIFKIINKIALKQIYTDTNNAKYDKFGTYVDIENTFTKFKIFVKNESAFQT